MNKIPHNVTQAADGRYFDDKGTEWFPGYFDENRPGLDRLWALRTDSAYMPMSVLHDQAFDRVTAGYKLPGENALSVSNKLLCNGARVMYNDGIKPIVGGIATILEGVVIIPLGYVVGGVMYFLKDKQ